MGARKKTENIQLVEQLSMSPSGGGYVPARNLSKRDLGGVIFGCKNNTMGECLTKKLFGLFDGLFLNSLPLVLCYEVPYIFCELS